MRRLVPISAVLVCLAVTSPALAESQHAAPQAVLDQLLQQHVDPAAADRDRVLGLLARPEVKELAGQLGLDLRRAASTIATLQGSELTELSAQARQVEEVLAGGQSRVTISTTLIIIALLVLILVIVAVD